MTTKTASIRLEKSKFKEIDEKCGLSGCNRNDFIKNAIENQLNRSYQAQNRFSNCSNCDEESHETFKMIIEKIHDADYHRLDEDDSGRPLHAEIDWNYEENTEPKITYKIIE